MIAYADSSVLVAWFHADDEFARTVTDWVREHVADQLSAQHATAIGAGTWDFFHVATALRQRAQVFATCDKLQADLAIVAQMPNVKLFRV